MSETRRYSLRFSSPRQEDAFNASRHQLLCLNISRIAAIGALAVLQQLGSVLLFASGGALHAQTRVYLASLCLLLALCLLWGTVPRLQRFQRRVSFRALEGIAMFMGLVLLAHWTDLAYHAGGLFLDDDVELLPGSKEHRQKAMATAALGLDAVATCWHLALPVRWFVIVWMDVLFVVIFAISSYTLRGLPRGDVEVVVVLTFSCLVMGASLGFRRAETKARALFATTLDELDFKAEPPTELAEKVAPMSPRYPSIGTTSPASSRDLIRFGDVVALGAKEQWVLDRCQVQINESAVLGEGSFGNVVAGEFLSTPVAVKCCKAESTPGSTHIVANVLSELNVLCRIRHPNIAVICGACFHSCDGGVTYKELRLVLEKVLGVSLRSYIPTLKAWNRMSPRSNDQVQIMKGVCRALIYMHSRQPCMVHGDLKPSSVMVESRTQGPFAKLLDSGIGPWATPSSTASGGARNYAAPEAFEPRRALRPPVDVFATGRLLFLVASGREPQARLGSLGDEESASGVPTSRLSWLPQTSLLQAQRPLIEMCCVSEPVQRPSAREVYEKLATWRAPSRPLATPRGTSTTAAVALTLGRRGAPGPGDGACPDTIEEELAQDSAVLQHPQPNLIFVGPSGGDEPMARMVSPSPSDEPMARMVSDDSDGEPGAEHRGQDEKKQQYLERLARAREMGIAGSH